MPTKLSGSIGRDHYHTILHSGQHTWHADEPASNGGGDTGPSPAQLVLSALAACKLITTRMYADRKGWPVDSISAELEMVVDTSARPVQTQMYCRLLFKGALSGDQRQRLLEIADKCPTHRLLTGDIAIHSNLVS